MGRVREIFQLANGKLPSYNSAFVKARGVAYHIDSFLTGTLRFARKVGSPLPIWLPDNSVELSKGTSPLSSTVSLVSPLSWIALGSKVVIGDNFFTTVDDILDDGYTLSLADTSPAAYPAGASLDLYGHPLELNGTYPVVAGLGHLPDEFVRGLLPTEGVVAVSDVPQILTANEPVIDGVTTLHGDRVLLVGQANPIENGIWVVSVLSAWARPSDFSTGSSASHSHSFSLGGTAYGASSWVCTSSVGFDTIGDTLVTGDPLTWAQFSNVTTFVIHSDYSIYPGDAINYGFLDYAIVEALPAGTLADGRTTYQITVDLGIPVTLEDGRSDQVFLRAYPAYESTRRPLPRLPLTEEKIGPFLYDRISGSFFEDLYVDEVDVVDVFNASGDRLARYKDAGKNLLLYNTAISADSFLFWDKTRGELNFSRESKSFVAFTDADGKFHMYYECVPPIDHLDGFEGWRTVVTPENDVYMVVELEPNPVAPPFAEAPPVRGGVLLTGVAPGGDPHTVNIDFPKGSAPITRIHVSFDSEVVPGSPTPGTRVDMAGWEIRGVQTAAFVSHATIAKVVGRNLWASGSMLAKPYWLRLTYLQVQSDLYSRFNSGLLST